MGRAFAAALPHVEVLECPEEFLSFHGFRSSGKSKWEDSAEGHGRDPVRQRVLQLAGIDDPQVFELRSPRTMCMDFVVLGASET